MQRDGLLAVKIKRKTDDSGVVSLFKKDTKGLCREIFSEDSYQNAGKAKDSANFSELISP
jgi:hypothetical protein